MKSQKDKRELNRLYRKLGYDHISFTIAPNVIVSKEAVTAEVLACLKSFNPKTATPSNGMIL
jgi:hypothetical protein